ncbi:MAG: Mrp/NBP35 family ATP-binding protein [Clostridia bacterium]|nr:Mrp/NBP35 family ATP-binding protein [Clostridia bacterium]
MSECTHDCSTCSADCSSKSNANDLKCKPNRFSKIKKVIGVVSGKGGVGKSSVTSMLAVLMQRRGYKVAVLDADITGPSIPKAFGIKEKATADEEFLFPVITKTGIEVMSINLLLEDESSPVVWRGPVLAGAVKQFFEEVSWNEVDYMFVDMPPGTGDVPLTVFQSLPIDGIVVVTTPQDLVTMVVDKAVKMAQLMKIKVLALVENMSYFVCPSCNEKHYIFGKSKIESEAKRLNVEAYSSLPIDPALARVEDNGLIELFEGDYLQTVVQAIEKL